MIDRNTQKKYTFGLRSKLLCTILLTVIISTILSAVNSIPKVTTLLSEAVENNLLNLSKSYGALIDTSLNNNDEVLSIEQYSDLLKDISIGGYTTGYAYLVSSSGTMMYHPTESKIGNPVENVVVTGLVAGIAKSVFPEPKVITYDFKGAMKYASYYISPIDHSILVVTLDQDEVFASLNNYKTGIILYGFIAVAILAIFGIIISSFITKPFKRLEDEALRISGFDLTTDKESDYLETRNDEAGVIAKAIATIRNELSIVINNIANVSNALHDSATNIQKFSSDMIETSSDNSATTEELAASMQETSATTDNIDDNIKQIKKHTEDITKLTIDGSKMANEILSRAEALKTSSQTAIDKTSKMYTIVKEKTNIAIEKSKAVDKIQELTDSIKAIATQTSLLSLNASIEAARAGEQGRGFAVVAGEIGSLATQSTDTVNNITKIVSEVQVAVSNMSECLLQTIAFLEDTVTTDYASFSEVGTQYSSDATRFDGSMKTICDSTNVLDKAIIDITSSIEGINTTISESANGISDIANKTSHIVDLTSQTNGMITDNLNDAKKLNEIVNKFKLM